MTQPLQASPDSPHRPMARRHLFIGVIIAVLGMLMFMMGPLIPYALVVLGIGIAYSVVAFVVGLMQNRADHVHA